MYAKRKNTQKAVLVLLAVVLVIGCAIGGTIAYLQMKTDPVVNTFTSSNVSITLTETGATEGNDKLEKSFKMVPGAAIPKDPKVIVAAGSEACYVFVEVNASNGVKLQGNATAADYITYVMADGWSLVTGQTNVYYKAVDAETAKNGTELPVLKDNQVMVLDTVTKDMMEAAKTTVPSLTFTAYAIQSANLKNGTASVTDAAGAWELINK